MIEDKIERAKRWIEEEEVRIALQTTITEQKPLVDFAKQVTETTDLISMNEMAKLLKQNKLNIGRNKLFAWLREKGYLMHNNLPYQRFIDSDLFRVKEVFKNKKMYTQTYVTGKGQMYIMNKLKAENVA
jgi:phage antirepressor YoqD-like protein